jgi:hypothetical protein
MFGDLDPAFHHQHMVYTFRKNIPEDPFPIVLPILQLPTLAFSPRVLLDVVSFREMEAP